MANLTQEQRAELAAFFWDHAEGRKEHDLITDGIGCVNFLHKLYLIDDLTSLHSHIRRHFDDYQDIFSFMEEYSDTLHDLMAKMEDEVY